LTVAILDSGAFAGHPHLRGGPVTGFGLVGDEPPLEREADFADRTGHGTAVAGVLRWLLPAEPLLIVRLLDAELTTTWAALAEAIRLAADEGARVINLSLGSARPEAREPLESAVDYAAGRGAICVAAAHPQGRTLLPADLPTVISAAAHRSCPVADLLFVDGPLPRFVAHGFPRPIEGRRPTDNLFGPSFAAAHVSARIARMLTENPALEFAGVVAGLRAQAIGPASSHAAG
jgi:hypothetical protein